MTAANSFEESISLFRDDLGPLLQNIITQVQPLTEEIKALDGQNFIGYECGLKLEYEEKTGKLHKTFSFWEVTVRLYWWDRDNHPHVVFSVGYKPREESDGSLFLVMGEGIPGSVSWWHPQSASTDTMFETIREALQSEKLEPFVIQELITLVNSACSAAYQSTFDELERRKLASQEETSS